MDRPLLALTRPASGLPVDDVSSDATEDMRQLMQLRWLAVFGQLITIVVVAFGLGVALPWATQLGVVGTLALSNAVIFLLLRRRRFRRPELLFALLLDLGVLTIQLYLSGGATNPFVSLYLVQIVLGVILLEPWAVAILLASTFGCFAVLTLSYERLLFPPELANKAVQLYRLGNWLSFALVATLLVLFIGRIIRNLRAREAYVADVRQRAAEEDHIVRMGLFASGAAHELGTPLASLSVILSDWKRVQKIARDPELMGEIAEMQAEVKRCKTIVTDILHSAGEERGEALESTPAASFLKASCAAWQAARPRTPLTLQVDGIRQARIVADAALRQAIWNLLDNAADASLDGVMCSASCIGDMLSIVVSDSGPGLPQFVLDNLGKPSQSTKGAGHGLGLFLVANVARRLGGRIEARNPEGGGAEVTLRVPLVRAEEGESS